MQLLVGRANPNTGAGSVTPQSTVRAPPKEHRLYAPLDPWFVRIIDVEGRLAGKSLSKHSRLTSVVDPFAVTSLFGRRLSLSSLTGGPFLDMGICYINSVQGLSLNTGHRAALMR